MFRHSSVLDLIVRYSRYSSFEVSVKPAALNTNETSTPLPSTNFPHSLSQHSPAKGPSWPRINPKVIELTQIPTGMRPPCESTWCFFVEWLNWVFMTPSEIETFLFFVFTFTLYTGFLSPICIQDEEQGLKQKTKWQQTKVDRFLEGSHIWKDTLSMFLRDHYPWASTAGLLWFCQVGLCQVM